MTKEMYHRFFREYQFDADLLFPDQEYIPYCYDEEKVNTYVKRQMDLHRIPLAVMCGEEKVGFVLYRQDDRFMYYKIVRNS